jgi:hypothetical protein
MTILKDDLGLMPQDLAADAMTLMFTHLPDWAMTTAAQFRNAAMGGGTIAINPMLNITEDHDVRFLLNLIKVIVADGCMIDFGRIPNEVIKRESVASRTLFESGELAHPYPNWLGVTNWEGGYNGYLVVPHPVAAKAILVIEMYGLRTPVTQMGDCILIYDMVSVEVAAVGQTMVTPTPMRYPAGHVETLLEQRNRGSNSLDPLVTMLRLLADASIPITHAEPPVKLNRARAKHGKDPIPGHSTVHTRDYVTGYQTHASGKRTAQGGHHASPVAHWRRGHMRHLKSGSVVAVRSSKINFRDAETLHRMFYRVKGPDQ